MNRTGGERVVHDFLTRMGPTPEHVRSAVEDFLTDDCVWENPGSPVCRGKPEICALLPADFARLDVRFRHVATTTATATATTADPTAATATATGTAADTTTATVLVERMESMFRTDGTPIALNLRVMGAFDLRNGLISAWRDYFDPTHLITERTEW
ncbi:limonene-1,2-epoxide hydrolase family protein [Streptomyces sp. DW26H14]|uniref:limonene-1,2-epoxide hydrolase family protein n=1 Tax=Streptomyces sp. DW26H14 TaxID=3435395 RepID=UPI00403DE380